ncbi:translocation/assembly module TamB domain-containing protein [Roseomonas sp. CCTCC AB2023176]|uniref:translocation/assembly module TamB domain-containing protein n=1 Tax=Roseomonas sp. CCTCC AB2023176 TaxID=3342640 RepID=UPI0035E2F330
MSVDALSLPRIELGQMLAGIPAVLAAEGGGRVGTEGAFVNLKARRLDAPGALDADVALRPGDRLRLALTYDEPPGGIVAGLLGGAERASRVRLSLDGPAEGAPFTLEAEIADKARASLRGSLALPATGGVGLEVEGDAALPGFLPAPVAELRLAARVAAVPGGATRVERLRVEAAPGVVEASGTLADALALDVSADLRGSSTLGALVPAVVGWDGVVLRGHIEGPATTPRVRAEATLRGPVLPGPLAGLLGPAPVIRVDAEPTRVHALSVEGVALRAEAAGAIGDPLDLTLRVSLSDVEVPDVPVRGRLEATAHVTGPRSDPAVALTADSPALRAYGRVVEALRLEASLPRATVPAGSATASGRLQGLALSLEARAAAEGSRMRVQALRASLGPARLEGSGVVDTASLRGDAALRLDAPDLGPLSGIVGVPLAGAVRLEARLAPLGERQGVDATLSATNLRAAGNTLDGTLRATGTDAALDVTGDLRAFDARAQLRARLALDAPEKRAEIASLDVTRGPLGVRLATPGVVTYGPDGAVTTPGLSIAVRPGGTLRVAGRWGPTTADLRAEVAALPLSAVNIFVPDPPVAGSVSGDVRLSGPVARPIIEGDVRGTGLRVGAPWARGVPEGTVRATARSAGDSVQAQAELRLGAALSLNLDARLPAAGEGPITGTLRGTTDVAVLAAPFVLGTANRVAGTVAVDVRASGTVAAPVLAGTARLTGGSVRNLEYGVTLRDITASLRGDADRVVLESLTARAGTGTLTARGDVRPFAAGIPVEVTISGTDLQPVQSDLLRSTFATDLRLTGGVASGMRLSGRLRADTATVNIAEGLPGGVADLGEVREVGRGAPPPPLGTAIARRAAARNERAPARRGGNVNQAQARPRATPAAEAAPAAASPLALDVAFEVPGRFYVRGRGLDAEVGGTVQIGGTAAAPLAQGELRLRRGTFTVLDRRLTFSRGIVRFTGDALSPDLDFLATTTATSTTINVAITGTPRDPKIEFTSSPELPQDEVLARLLFNRSVDKLSPFQIAQLARVVSGALSGGQEDPVSGVLGRITRTLGLDRLGVGSGANGAPGLEAGGYLGQGIYLRVDPGATTGSPRVGVEIELTPRLRLESGAGTDGQSVGLSYEYEY